MFLTFRWLGASTLVTQLLQFCTIPLIWNAYQIIHIFANSLILSLCVLVIPHEIRELGGQHWFRWWLGAWWHQAITWSNADQPSVSFFCTQMGTIWQAFEFENYLLRITVASPRHQWVNSFRFTFQTFEDGSLYINNLGLHHMGNYTCRDALNPHVIQTHILRVQCKFISL